MRKFLIFLPLAFFSYAEQDSLDKDPLLQETLKVQSRFPSYRVQYDYNKVIEEVKTESQSEDNPPDNLKKPE